MRRNKFWLSILCLPAVAIGAETIQRELISKQNRLVPLQKLTSREEQVLELIASGATNIEIGGELHLSPNTVKGHTRSLYRKLNARNRAEAVQRAQTRGMLT